MDSLSYTEAIMQGQREKTGIEKKSIKKGMKSTRSKKVKN